MTPAEALAQHLTTRPELPRPLPAATDPAYREWLRAFTTWAAEKERLECLIRIGKMEFQRTQPRCTPAADYEWLDITAPTRPAWSGTRKEYNAAKKRESRARQTPEQKAARLEARKKWDAERRAKIREGLNQRKGEAA